MSHENACTLVAYNQVCVCMCLYVCVYVSVCVCLLVYVCMCVSVWCFCWTSINKMNILHNESSYFTSNPYISFIIIILIINPISNQ